MTTINQIKCLMKSGDWTMKHIKQMLLVATAILAPLAARADVVTPFPLPGIQGALLLGLLLFCLYGIPLFLGGCLVCWLYRKLGHGSPMPRRILSRRICIAAITLFVLFEMLGFFVRHSAEEAWYRNEMESKRKQRERRGMYSHDPVEKAHYEIQSGAE